MLSPLKQHIEGKEEENLVNSNGVVQSFKLLKYPNSFKSKIKHMAYFINQRDYFFMYGGLKGI